jgi:hypothetical protein
LTAHTRWKLCDFNSDEDLVLLTDDGRIFILDLVQGIIKEKSEFEELSMYPNEFSTIEGAKLD